MKHLSKADIFNQSDHKRELVDIPEWGGALYVRSLTAGERDEYEQSCVEMTSSGELRPKLANSRARLAVMVCVDQEGNRIFDDDDAPELGRRSAIAVERICEVAKRLSGMAQGAVEAGRKNSYSAPCDGFSFASP